MADGSLTLKLDDYTTAKISERARTMGMPAEALAAMVLDARFRRFLRGSGWADLGLTRQLSPR